VAFVWRSDDRGSAVTQKLQRIPVEIAQCLQVAFVIVRPGGLLAARGESLAAFASPVWVRRQTFTMGG